MAQQRFTLLVGRESFNDFRAHLRKCDKLSFKYGAFRFWFTEERAQSVLESVFESKPARRAVAGMMRGWFSFRRTEMAR